MPRELAIDVFNLIVIATIILVLALLLVGYWATHKPKSELPATPEPESPATAVSIGLTALGLAVLVSIVIALVVVIQNRRNHD